MKFATVILPLVAVLAQSAPVEVDEGSRIPKSSKEDKETTQTVDYNIIFAEYSKVQNAFDNLGIDSAQFYCSEYWNSDVIEYVMETPELNDKVLQFQNFLQQYSMYPDEYFCGH